MASRNSSGRGLKILIGIIIYIIAFVGVIMYTNKSTRDKMVEINTIEDLAQAERDGSYGRIQIDEFTDAGQVTLIKEETVKQGSKQVKKDKYVTTSLYSAEFDGETIYLIDYQSAPYEKFMNDKNAFVEVNKLSDYRYQNISMTIDQNSYVIGYQTALGKAIFSGGMFLVVTTVILAFLVSIIKKVQR